MLTVAAWDLRRWRRGTVGGAALAGVSADNELQQILHLLNPQAASSSDAGGTAADAAAAAAAPALDKRLAALKSDNGRVREKAALDFGQAADAAAVEGLIKTIQDADAGVRSAAIWALGRIKDARAVPALIEHLAADGSGEAVWALCSIGRPAVDELVATLGDVSDVIRNRAKQALDLIENPRALESLLFVLKHGDAEDRRAAVRGLQEHQDERIPSALIDMLRDKDMGVRQEAIKTLARLKDPLAVEPLLETLAVPELFPAAAAALGELRAERAIKPLIVGFKRFEETECQEAAIEALVKIGSPAIGFLAETLQEPEERVRINAAWALGRIKDPLAIDPLVTAIIDPSLLVRAKVVEALGEFNTPKVTETLIGALKDKNLLVVVKAINVLGDKADQRAGESLIALLGSDNRYVRENAAGALGKLRERRAIPSLVALLNDPMAEIAIATLNKIIGEQITDVNGWLRWWDRNKKRYTS